MVDHLLGHLDWRGRERRRERGRDGGIEGGREGGSRGRKAGVCPYMRQRRLVGDEVLGTLLV